MPLRLITSKIKVYMIRFQNIYALNSKHTCFIRADSCIWVHRLLEFVGKITGNWPGIDENRFRIVHKTLFLALKKSKFPPKMTFIHTCWVKTKGFIQSKCQKTAQKTEHYEISKRQPEPIKRYFLRRIREIVQEILRFNSITFPFIS